MPTSTTTKTAVTLLHAFILWALCGAVVGIGRNLWTMETTLIVHLIAAPIIGAVISFVYFRKFAYTTPLQTACIFVGFIVFLDFFVVALLIEKSFAMFGSAIGTWIPFALIFISAYIVGTAITKPEEQVTHYA